jgi:glycosyltransferase involved in cell wall biosynthesis
MTVSIIIPTYNRPKLLPRAVKSALTACPPDGEVIVVDDRSDTAVKALEGLISDPRLRIFTNTGDKGAAGARNHAIAQASGEIVMFLDDDDVMVADYPERVIAAAWESGADWGFSNIGMVDDIDAPTATAKIIRRPLVTGIIDTATPLIPRLPAFSHGFWACRSMFEAIGLISTDQVVNEDYDFCCRLYGHKQRAWFEAEPGCIYSAGYDVVHGQAPQLTRSTPALIEAACQYRTFQRNQHLFGRRSADRWSLICYLLRNLAFLGLDDHAKDMLRDLTPLDWRIRAWLFWQMKKRGKHIHQRRVARRLARG